MKDDLYSEGGPVPTTPAEFADEVQAIVLDPLLTTAAALDVQLGQLAFAYADTLLPAGLRCRFGPWPSTDDIDAALGVMPRPVADVDYDDHFDLHPCSPEEIERTGVDARQPDGVPLDDRDDPRAVRA